METENNARVLQGEEAFSISRRARAPNAKYYGTLNLFGGDVDSHSSGGANDTAVNGNDGPSSQQQPLAKQRVRAYHNKESRATREFPLRSVRRVTPVTHVETPKGLRQVASAAGKQQNVQVVNITAAYADPMSMPPERPCVQFYPERVASAAVRDALGYADCQSTQLRGELAAAPVGAARVWRPNGGVIDYTRQERFCQSVRDHVQQRARGATEFYVQLCRDTIGGAAASASAPAPVYERWSLEREPPRHRLCFARCHAQLVGLTGIAVTPLELADLLWDMEDFRQRAAVDESIDAMAILGPLLVLYKDFAAAFAGNSSNERLAVLKI